MACSGKGLVLLIVHAEEGDLLLCAPPSVLIDLFGNSGNPGAY